ncbi:MAG TPA: serine hydrolase [Steroidobacteraceae bacterium]|nr:serine hydrolase [Steroidobacteraceae bacterium]
MNRYRYGTVGVAALTVVGLLSASAAWADPEVPAALQSVRRHVLDAGVNALTFHSMDQIFETRRVDNAGPVWELPSNPQPLRFSYTHAGQTHQAEEVLERTFTNALVIVKHGRIVAEVYRNKTDAATHFISFSMAKSITSVLIGLAVADGHIHSIEDPITRYVPELMGSAYEGVTIRQALMMRSGADFEERYDFDHPGLASAAFEESLVRNRVRFASFGRILTRAHEPGSQFNYSTVETAVLGWVLERATRQSISHYMAARLWKPAGMEAYGFWILDGTPQLGREFNGAGFNAVARDFARFGLMMLRNGKAAGRQIVPENWVRESTAPRETTPLAAGMPLGYRYQWWTLPGSDAYLALGLQGQFIYVDPATDTVVVKLSYFPPDNTNAPEEETLDFLRAASEWKP